MVVLGDADQFGVQRQAGGDVEDRGAGGVHGPGERLLRVLSREYGRRRDRQGEQSAGLGRRHDLLGRLSVVCGEAGP